MIRDAAALKLANTLFDSYKKAGMADDSLIEKVADLIKIYVEADELDAKLSAQKPRFPEVFCSHCGGAFPAADHGYSHCENHKGIARHD